MADTAFLHFPADAVDPMVMLRLPESARRVFGVVRTQGPLTYAQLNASVAMPPRTVRYAIKSLKDAGLIETRCSLRDCRTCYFFVHRTCAGLAALDAPGGPTAVPAPAAGLGKSLPLA